MNYFCTHCFVKDIVLSFKISPHSTNLISKVKSGIFIIFYTPFYTLSEWEVYWNHLVCLSLGPFGIWLHIDWAYVVSDFGCFPISTFCKSQDMPSTTMFASSLWS